MAERKFIIYPAAPLWRPSEAQKVQLQSFFFNEVSPDSEKEYSCTFDVPHLVGHGEKSTVTCPKCSARLRLFSDDYEPTDYYHWWKTLSSRPGTSTAEMPCCGGLAKLLELKFCDGDEYACFFLGVREPDCYNAFWHEPAPGAPEELGTETVARMERILGTKIKQLWVYET